MKGSPPKEGSYIYMFNHGSFIDPFVFAYTMNAPATALVAKENYRYPIWNLMLKRWKAIPIERKNKDIWDDYHKRTFGAYTPLGSTGYEAAKATKKAIKTMIDRRYIK